MARGFFSQQIAAKTAFCCYKLYIFISNSNGFSHESADKIRFNGNSNEKQSKNEAEEKNNRIENY